MTLYFYRIGESVPALLLTNVASYTADRVEMVDGGICSPLADGWELSSLPDCSETLRADWRSANLSETERLNAIESAIEKGMSLWS